MAWSGEKHNVRLSKTLSKLLRHDLLKEGLSPDEGGYVPLEQVLSLPRMHGYTPKQVEEVVRLNDKQRFALTTDDRGRRLIRANQGHSIKGLDPGLVPVTDASAFPDVIHGTYAKKWESIKKRGLSRMVRNHIHFAPGRLYQDNVVSGMRRDCNLLIYVNMAAAIDAGFSFFESSNKVILCPGDESGFLPTKFFQKVILLRGDAEFDLLAEKKQKQERSEAAAANPPAE